jgi:FtsP/CotA-like multicopper oxidase with cupredoxin domain
MNLRHPAIMKSLVFAFVLATAVRLSAAAEYFLRAEATTLTMPDGREVTMWGFAKDSSFEAHDGTVMVPGPQLEVPVGDGTLTIHLENNLPAGNPVSIVIPGQAATMVPVRHPAGGDYAGRVRSFTQEAQPGNTEAVTYTWSSFRPGTFLYQSGSHPALQVQMGLYGAVKKNFADGEAYEGVGYDREVLLLLSEIDPDLHLAVENGEYGPGLPVSSTTSYHPKYFLVNGAPYTSSSAAIAAGTPGERVLVRLLNAGITTHSMLLQGLYMKTLAEDAFPCRYPRERYCLALPALKTTDVLVTAPAAGTYALYDRALRLTNDTAGPGGLMAFLEVVEN